MCYVCVQIHSQPLQITESSTVPATQWEDSKFPQFVQFIYLYPLLIPLPLSPDLISPFPASLLASWGKLSSYFSFPLNLQRALQKGEADIQSLIREFVPNTKCKDLGFKVEWVQLPAGSVCSCKRQGHRGGQKAEHRSKHQWLWGLQRDLAIERF